MADEKTKPARAGFVSLVQHVAQTLTPRLSGIPILGRYREYWCLDAFGPKRQVSVSEREGAVSGDFRPAGQPFAANCLPTVHEPGSIAPSSSAPLELAGKSFLWQPRPIVRGISKALWRLRAIEIR